MAEKSGKSSIMKNCVISLTTAVERREHIAQEFGKQGIAFEFFDAITPNKINELSTQFGIPLSNNQRLSLGEKACFLSHVSLWQKMLDENIDYMAIFEDDVYLGENAQLFLTNDDWLKTLEFDLIKLETWQELVHIDTQHHLSVHHRQLVPLKSTHVGACGYIITKKTANWLINHLKTHFDIHSQAVDHVLFGLNLNKLMTYQLTPAICIQSDRHNNRILSNLEKTRKNHYNHPMNFSQKIHRRIMTWKRSIGKRLFYTTIPFQ